MTTEDTVEIEFYFTRRNIIIIVQLLYCVLANINRRSAYFSLHCPEILTLHEANLRGIT